MIHFPKITQSLLPVTHPKLEYLLYGGQMGSLSFQLIYQLLEQPALLVFMWTMPLSILLSTSF